MESSEVWRGVVGYEGYQVSSLGRVKSLPKSIPDMGGRRVRNYPERILRQQAVNKYGHLKVGLVREGVCREFLVHRLVLMAFDRLPCEGEECLHKDGAPSNNKRENLRWGSSLENSADCLGHGRTARGTRLPQSKLKEEDVLSIRGDVRTNVAIAADYGLSPSYISSIKNRKNWTHI